MPRSTRSKNPLVQREHAINNYLDTCLNRVWYQPDSIVRQVGFGPPGWYVRRDAERALFFGRWGQGDRLMLHNGAFQILKQPYGDTWRLAVEQILPVKICLVGRDYVYVVRPEHTPRAEPLCGAHDWRSWERYVIEVGAFEGWVRWTAYRMVPDPIWGWRLDPLVDAKTRQRYEGGRAWQMKRWRRRHYPKNATVRKPHRGWSNGDAPVKGREALDLLAASVRDITKQTGLFTRTYVSTTTRPEEATR